MNGPKRPRDEPPGAFCESNIATRCNQCTIVTNEPTTTQVRYKTLDKYATRDEAKAALDSMIGQAWPKL